MSSGTVRNLLPTRELGDYCDFLYGKEEGWVYLPTKNEEGSPEPWSKYFVKWPENRQKVLDHVGRHSKSKDVYIGPSLFRTPSTADIENVHGSSVLWADFDDKVPTSRDLRERKIPEPSLRVQSSPGREHWYWKLEQFYTDIKTVQDHNRALAYALEADPSGWDASQVLRPVGSINHKRKGNSVVIKAATGGKYTTSDFREIPMPDAGISVISFPTGNLPNAQRLLIKYAFKKEAIDLLLKPEIQEGSRSGALTSLTYHLCEHGLDNSEIYSILRMTDARWKKFFGREDAEKRYIGLINYARIKHPYLGATDAKPAEPRRKFLSYFDILHYADTQTYIMEPKILPDLGFLYVAGRSGVGKSNLTIELAHSIILNKDLLDWKIPETDTQHRVMHLCLEMHTTEVKEVLTKMDGKYTDDERKKLDENYMCYATGDAWYLYNEVHLAELDEAIEAYKPTVVLIDSASVSFAPSLKEDEKTIRISLKNLMKLRLKHKFANIVVGHGKKGTEKGSGLDGLFGMTVIEQETSTIIMLTENEPRTEELRMGGDDETMAIDVTYIKHRFGSLKGKTFSAQIVSNPLRFVRPVLAPISASSADEDMMNRISQASAKFDF